MDAADYHLLDLVRRAAGGLGLVGSVRAMALGVAAALSAAASRRIASCAVRADLDLPDGWLVSREFSIGKDFEHLYFFLMTLLLDLYINTSDSFSGHYQQVNLHRLN